MRPGILMQSLSQSRPQTQALLVVSSSKKWKLLSGYNYLKGNRIMRGYHYWKNAKIKRWDIRNVNYSTEDPGLWSPDIYEEEKVNKKTEGS